MRVPRETAPLGPSRCERAETRPLPDPEPGPGAKSHGEESLLLHPRPAFPGLTSSGGGPRAASGSVFCSRGDPIATHGRELQQDRQVSAQGDRPGGGRLVFGKGRIGNAFGLRATCSRLQHLKCLTVAERQLDGMSLDPSCCAPIKLYL